jgi:hypothetical protein
VAGQTLKCVAYYYAVYVPVDATVGSTSLSVMIMTSGTKAFLWRIRATQIDCKTTPELVGKKKLLYDEQINVMIYRCADIYRIALDMNVKN